MEHPMISQINRTGYPKVEGLENVIAQPEHVGIDVFGTEILEGDEICIDQDNFQELILKEHLKPYLIEKMNFVFKGGWVIDRNGFDYIPESELEKYLQEQYNFKFITAE